MKKMDEFQTVTGLAIARAVYKSLKDAIENFGPEAVYASDDISAGVVERLGWDWDAMFEKKTSDSEEII